MDPTDLSDAELDQLADQLAGRLPSGTHGDNVILSRRAFAAAVGGTLGASGLVALGVDPAAAQAAGQVGTSADPVDAFTYDLVVQNALQSDLDAGGNALTNVGSLSTDEQSLTISQGTVGDAPIDSIAGNQSLTESRTIKQVSTTTTRIAPEPNVGVAMAQAVVSGVRAAGGNERFIDIVLYGHFAGFDRIGSHSTGSPAGRTYDESGDGLELAMGSDTYNIIVKTVFAEDQS